MKVMMMSMFTRQRLRAKASAKGFRFQIHANESKQIVKRNQLAATIVSKQQHAHEQLYITKQERIPKHTL